MNEHRLTLAKRLAASPNFRWLPGMAFCDPANSLWAARFVNSDLEWVLFSSHVSSAEIFAAVPDLDDEVTRLAMAAVARAAWGDHTLHATPMSREGQRGGWQVWTCDRESDYIERGDEGPTEEAAWVEAICAAPPRQ